MKIAILAPIAWSTPPKKYGPWEQVASTIAEGLVANGHDVSLFATGDSQTGGKLEWVCSHPYAEDAQIDPKVWECLHISNLMERAGEFDIIHNHFDFLPLTYSRFIEIPMITTIHGFSSEKILPVYQKYNATSTYISISDANRHPSLHYLDTIYHGIDSRQFSFREKKGDYLLYFGRIHPEKGTNEAIKIAISSGFPLKIAGLIQDRGYFENEIKPYLKDNQVEYLGNADPVLRNKLLGGARALLHPISFEEPFGLSVAEAMMCGTPVIAYNRGSMPELIVHKKTGFLVNNVSEAVEAVHQLEIIAPQDCRDHALQNFSIATMISAYEKAYQKTLQKF